MTNKLVVILNSTKKYEKLRKFYYMKFLVPNYSCIQNPWPVGYRPHIPILSVLCLQLNLFTPPPRTKFLVMPLYRTTDTVSLLESDQAGSVVQAPTYSLVPPTENAAYTASLNNAKSTQRTDSVMQFSQYSHVRTKSVGLAELTLLHKLHSNEWHPKYVADGPVFRVRGPSLYVYSARFWNRDK